MTNFFFFSDKILKIPAQEFKSHSGVIQSSFAFTFFGLLGDGEGWGEGASQGSETLGQGCGSCRPSICLAADWNEDSVCVCVCVCEVTNLTFKPGRSSRNSQ